MIQIPIFKPHLCVQIIPGEGVLLLSELDGPRALHGALYEAVARLIDGRRSADDIVDALTGRFDAAHVYYALTLLEKNGHLLSADTAPDLAGAAFWSSLKLDPAAATRTLAAARVHLHAVGMVDLAPLREALRAQGLACFEADGADGPDKQTLHIVLTDDYQRADLLTLAQDLHQRGRAWLPVRLQGQESWLGPIYSAQTCGCHACLVRRLARNNPAIGYARHRLGQDEVPITARAALPSTLAVGAALLAGEVAKYLAGDASVLQAQMLSVNHLTLATQTHRLIADNHCPVCGQPAAAGPPQPVQLQARRARYCHDGGHRSAPPEKTLERYQHLVSPISGVVTRLTPVYQAEGIVHVYTAGHNPALHADSLDFLKRGLRNASSGKGASDAQAKVSALCEAIERYSGERQGDEQVVTASYHEMQARHGDAVIPPNAVMHYSERQLDTHEQWNARKSKFNRVPEPLDEDVPIDWTPLWSRSEARHKYLPTQLVYYQSPASQACKRFFAMGCSNGNASGNNLEEAVLQGFFELVERDATALWWYNRLPKAGVDVASFGEPWLLDLVRYYDGQGRDAWALDLTSDLGIPAFVAISRLRDGAQQRILFGLGCHLDARIALQRAFAEMNQMLGLAQPSELAAASALDDDEVLRWLSTATVDNQPYLKPDPNARLRGMADFPKQHSGDLLSDIDHCQRIVEARGLEMLLLDQTRADVGLAVAKVVVPGLRHFWARYGAGRLYQVPVDMGWLAAPLDEDALNPIPIFF
ncbi:MAG: hypothetical protein RJA34_2806 [Pseudomonadota bacterium]|jgi:ribosomal protein S12 methylthiotransferase accessory factor